MSEQKDRLEAALALAHEGQTEAAEAEIQAVLSETPEDYTANAVAAEFYFRNLNDGFRSLQYFQKALEQRVSFDVLLAFITALMREGYFMRAAEAARVGIERFPDRAEMMLALETSISVQGHWQTGNKLIEQICTTALEDARALAARNGWPRPRLFLHPFVPLQTHVGEMTSRLDTLFKLQALGQLPDVELIWPTLDDRDVANPCLFNYYAELLPQQAETSPAFQKTLQDIGNSYFSTDRFQLRDYGGRRLQSAWHIANRLWAEQNRPPVLSLKESHREDGEATLRKMGLADGDWYVLFHIREGGYRREDGGVNASEFRNSNVRDYYEAMQAITAKGGWVIRMGDASMTPLPDMARVIDYARSSFKSDWMDVFLCATARFCVGTTSGLAQIPTCFGVPVLSTNAFPFFYFFGAAGDRYIHKMVSRRDTGALLPIRQMFTPPVHHQNAPRLFEEMGLDVIPNSAEEITAAVEDMYLAVIKGQKPTEAEDALWKAYEAAADFEGIGIPLRVSTPFLEKYRELY